MCGIVGYTGVMETAPILIEGLSRLEYRGYDSAGIAVVSPGNGGPAIEIIKARGRLQALREMTDNGRAVRGTCGIGHTRWATHGEPSVVNAHPHFSKDKKIAVVHNGIIENYKDLKEWLGKKGFEFISETDTEVVAHLLDYYYKGNPLEAICKMLGRVRGSYALGILFQDFPDKIYAVRKDSPLIIGTSDQGNFIASDVPAILKYTKTVCYVDDMDIVELSTDHIRFFNTDQEEIQKEFKTVQWDAKAAEKEGFEHFMLKEIYEQPKAVADTISPRIKDGNVVLDELEMTEEDIKKISRIQMVACGSAYHVCMCGKYILEQMAKIPVDVDLASEFRYRQPILGDNTLVIVISQSGETADSLAALREAKKLGHKVLAIVNVVGSSIAREADSVLYTWAGPEISVATTKAYSTQLAAIYLIALLFGRTREVINQEDYKKYVAELGRLPEKIQRILDEKERIQWLANKFSHAKDVFFIGRGLDYAISMEGSLKLKEISYIHSEAYAAGELKHGTISLIENGVLVIGVATQPELFEKEISNLVEVRSRGASVLGLTLYGNYAMEDIADFTIYVPKTEDYFTTSLAVIPLQLLAYYISVARGLDVDKPRNLAKSVTVE
ncbi:glucosamine--fructose-6-phosphate aminotransferase (isomerizing) [Catenibacillus scindens]|uniref:Glutamine--fructose-6-phosphate aminotransferase [isomerizing] n=1 Tax=Catenibacillus scindens TaxID=673271 RepID=A0A7W8M482_9FIRM|nr:glutamine--fructose-6-phosphate transaminase (isomerizing) [Catenibacillus scindens]MBB5263873.1 glucosamine--fructose-6-phosphate aminotransferase (isomerizing) [Catenibacillus scindens]